MSLETLTEQERNVFAREAVAAPPQDDPLRPLALERIYRLRRLNVHLVVFLVGVPLLAALWVLTEYYEEHTWPSRFASAPDVAGTWDPWFFWAAGIWAIVLGIHALRAWFGPPVGPLGRYIRRPVPEAEVERQIERLRSGR